MHLSAEPQVAVPSIPYALEKAQAIAAQFEYSDDEVRKCIQKFLQQMDEGLRERTPAMCQIPTYVTRVANGTEKGSALGVDLGGTNLRVCLVELHGDTSYHAVQTKTLVPPTLMVSHEATRLFDFIAEQLETLIKIHRPDSLSGLETEVFSLGLTFSFPVYQNAINSGILLRWTKGFDIPSIIGQDVCELLQHQIDLRNLPVRVTALVNDAAGIIMSRAYSLPADQTCTSIGTIFGTGTNGVYLEKLSKITKTLDGGFDRSTGEMFISIEWGSFDNDLSVLPNTQYDIEVNEASINPGNQMFEKRVSGMFLGELLRLVLLELQDDPEIKLFHRPDMSTTGESIDKTSLHTRWAVDSSILSVAELDVTEELTMLRQKVVDVFGISSSLVGIDDAHVVKVIAHAIGKRAARLSGMALGAVILKTERLATPESFGQSKRCPGNDGDASVDQKGVVEQGPEEDIAKRPVPSLPSDWPCLVDVGFDGSVVEFYPRFETYMREALRAVKGIGLDGEKRIRMGLAKDGSSVGAAIIALVVAQNG